MRRDESPNAVGGIADRELVGERPAGDGIVPGDEAKAAPAIDPRGDAGYRACTANEIRVRPRCLYAVGPHEENGGR